MDWTRSGVSGKLDDKLNNKSSTTTNVVVMFLPVPRQMTSNQLSFAPHNKDKQTLNLSMCLYLKLATYLSFSHGSGKSTQLETKDWRLAVQVKLSPN